MKVHRSYDLVGASAPPLPVVLALGSIDGVHLGHELLLAEVRFWAQVHAAEAWVGSFHPHPRVVLAPDSQPPFLISLEDKLARFESLGMAGVWLAPFDREIAASSPKEFILKLLTAFPGCKAIVIGENWRFGKGAVGCPESLARLGEELGFEVKTVGLLEVSGESVSSSRIRELIQAGELASVEPLLGRAYSLRGDVVHGKKIGRQIGFPTANVKTSGEQLLPPPGIYATEVCFLTNEAAQGATQEPTQEATQEAAQGGTQEATQGAGEDMWLPAAGYVSSAMAEADTVEVHLLDWSGDCYGQRLQVRFLSRLREDAEFTSEAALIAQIRKDVVATGDFFRKREICTLHDDADE